MQFVACVTPVIVSTHCVRACCSQLEDSLGCSSDMCGGLVWPGRLVMYYLGTSVVCVALLCSALNRCITYCLHYVYLLMKIV